VPFLFVTHHIKINMNKKLSLMAAQKLAHAYDLFNQGYYKDAEDTANQILKKKSKRILCT
jgi:hypothetical protein